VKLNTSLVHFFQYQIQINKFISLEIKPEHLDVLLKIKPVRNHKDRFDFLLVSQAKYENLELKTYDEKVKEYFEPLDSTPIFS